MFTGKSDTLPESMVNYIIINFIKSCTHKTVYVYGTDTHYDIWGTMFSGKYVTSTGDTIYQMLLLKAYLSELRERNLDHEAVIDAIDADMVLFFFYGDDHEGGWPEYLNGFLLFEDSETILHDFVKYCTVYAGMKHKKGSFKIMDKAVGVRVFETRGREIIEVGNVDSPSFLKTKTCHIYLDGVYMGVQPYRETSDLLSKVSLTINATKNSKLALCLYCSLALLCAGNLEAYSRIGILYEELVAIVGEPDVEDWERFREMKFDSRSLKNAVDSVTSTGYPSLVSIHLKQNVGYRTGEGFPARDVDGEEVPLYTVYSECKEYYDGFRTVPFQDRGDDDDDDIEYFEGDLDIF